MSGVRCLSQSDVASPYQTAKTDDEGRETAHVKLRMYAFLILECLGAG
jgi:hypothetical protein